jgi:regulator of protease activity HflC (stomatin/prohibitin superfamily)
VRPAAGYLMLGAVVCFIVAATEAAAWFDFVQADVYAARLFCVVLGIAAVENLIGLVFEIYRPRVKGQETRVLYESRLIGLLGHPGGLITTAAQALDYQFGFKVSETWFYKLLEKAVAWIVLLQLGALWLSTFVVVIDPNEQGLLERGGRPAAGRAVLGPGLHFKWPWPIDKVYRYETGALRQFVIGVIADEDAAEAETILWTRPHYQEEFNMLVASREPVGRADQSEAGEKPVPANLLVVSIPVQYRITDLEKYVYGHANSDELVESIANREVVRYLVSVDLDEVMSTGRRAAGEALQSRIQAEVKAQGLGVDVVFVGLQGIHPPIGTREMPVAAAFEEVVGAMQQMQTNILGALAYEAERVPSAHAEATNLIAEAWSDQQMKVATARGEAGRFANQVAAFEASPSAYRQRVYLEALAKSIASVRKYVLAATNTEDVVILNLEQKIRQDLATSIILPPDATAAGETEK